MPTTKHELLDWLMDVPEDAEKGTDGAGLGVGQVSFCAEIFMMQLRPIDEVIEISSRTNL